jgi:PAS domain S-box-containing protein
MGETRGRPTLDPVGYERLRNAAPTYRQRLAVRLCGEVGLRPAEIARLRTADVSARAHAGSVHYFLSVRDGSGGYDREAYLPDGVKRELDRYVESEAVDPDEPVFDVSPRRIQMLVGDVADRAAEAGDPVGDVSSADLRRHFARAQLRRGVPPAVVMAVGGWTRLDGLADDPGSVGRGTVAAAFARAGEDGDDRFRAAFDRLDRPVLLLDAGGVVDHVNERFEALAGVDAASVVGTELAQLAEPAGGATHSELWESVLADETWRGPVTCSVPDGGRIGADLTVSAIGDRSRPDGFVATFDPAEDSTTATDAPTSGADGTGIGDAQSHLLGVGDAVAAASTREGVLSRTCRRLVDGEFYRGAWVFDLPIEEESTPVEAAGPSPCPDGATTLAGAAVSDGVTDSRSDGDDHSAVAVPLTTGETRYGALVVDPADRSVTAAEKRALAALGRRVAGTLGAVEWKRLLLADALLELELRSTDRDSLFVGASASLGCSLSVEGLVPLDGDSLLYYVSVADVPTERALEHFGGAAESARLIAAASDDSLLEVTGPGDSLLGELTARGAHVTELTAEEGAARLTCELAPNADVRELVEGVSAVFPGVRLVAKREVERSVRTPTEFQQALEERLTDKQRSVLQAAYHAGYFDWPRGSTAEELADSIGVSSPTLHNHLRRAQRKLLAAFFDGEN